MTLEFEVDVDYLTNGGIKDMPTWVKLNDEDGGRPSTVYVNTSSYWHVVDENAELRELVRRLHMAYVGTLNECEGKDIGLIWEYSCDIEGSLAKSKASYEADRHRFDVVMRELGVEVPS